MNQFDVVWRQDALGLSFTPNEHDNPVVCQVPPNVCPSILASPLAVGDILVAFDLHLPDQPGCMQHVRSCEQLTTMLCQTKLPVTLRFQSRKKDIPGNVRKADVLRYYVFTWAAQSPLGVSLAMDPCSLHAAITKIDLNKVSPAFQTLKPELGDVLLTISSTDEVDVIHLDEMRFEDVIRTLRQFPRPCRLTFAKLADEAPSDSLELNDNSMPSKPQNSMTDSKSIASTSQDQEKQTTDFKPPFLARPLKAHNVRRQLPISMRKSFRIDASGPPTPSASRDSQNDKGSYYSIDGRPRSGSRADDKGFYTVMFDGSAVGLQLRDCTQDGMTATKSNDKTSRTNGYNVAIRNVLDPKSASGLEIAAPDDLLMAIGQKDLQHMSYDEVQKELGCIQNPTHLLFKRRKRAETSVSGASLVDTLLLFLV